MNTTTPRRLFLYVYLLLCYSSASFSTAFSFRSTKSASSTHHELFSFFNDSVTQATFLGMKEASAGRFYDLLHGWERVHMYNTPMTHEEEVKFNNTRGIDRFPHWDFGYSVESTLRRNRTFQRVARAVSDDPMGQSTEKPEMAYYGHRYHMYAHPKENRIIIIFRASASSDEFNSNFIPFYTTIGTSVNSNNKTQSVRVRKSFYTIYQRLKGDIQSALLHQIKRLYKRHRQYPQIVFGGHSLGGSLATLSGGDTALFETLRKEHENSRSFQRQITRRNSTNSVFPPPKVIALASAGCGNKVYTNAYPTNVTTYRISSRRDLLILGMKFIWDYHVMNENVHELDVTKYDTSTIRQVLSFETHNLKQYLYIFKNILNFAKEDPEVV